MTQIDKDRWFSPMAIAYDKMASYLVPRYDFVQDELIGLLFADGVEDKFVVDLGAGSGILLDKVLERFPAARGCWVDHSQEFLSVARQRLAKYGRRVRFVLARLEGAWEDELAEAPDAICSMSAIHHLESADKRSLYARCFDRLRPGGWFFNADEMATVFPDAYINTLHYWLNHVERARQDVFESLAKHCRLWCEKFDKWRLRTVENAHLPKAAGDDIHQGYVEQMQWLGEIGFVNVDLFVKFQLWSLIGGQKHGASA